MLKRQTPVFIYVSLFTFWILKIDLKSGAKNFGLLIKIIFILSPQCLFFTANYTKDDDNNRKNSCYPYRRTTAGYDTADTKSYPQIVTSAHFLHCSITSIYRIYYILCRNRLIVTLNEKNFSAFKFYINLTVLENIALGKRAIGL